MFQEMSNIFGFIAPFFPTRRSRCTCICPKREIYNFHPYHKRKNRFKSDTEREDPQQLTPYISRSSRIKLSPVSLLAVYSRNDTMHMQVISGQSQQSSRANASVASALPLLNVFFNKKSSGYMFAVLENASRHSEPLMESEP
ncbi:hypothetical protein CEXT_213871 [Caerostris extrusa]|uniref:Uncharacterized protein n=1 Tax=Caerostris extrusa TaxID=172846 RepID=A0AAV4MT78_CAEEX|nr:hypothetical protein CEXT_213871 [Caerostris extrusa]